MKALAAIIAVAMWLAVVYGAYMVDVGLQTGGFLP